MIPILAILSMLGLAIAGLWGASKMSSAPWKRVARFLGLEFHQSFLLASPRLRGTLRGFEVEVFQYDKAIGLDVRGVDPGFTLERDSILAQMISPDIETGDADFDGRTRIKGDVDRALALLDHETRQAVDRLVERDDDKIGSERIRKKVFDFQDIGPTLDAMLDLAEVLRCPTQEDLPRLLSRRALEDPSPGTRLRAFRRLASSFYRTDEVLQTARQLRDTESTPLRLEALTTLLREPAPEGADAAGELMNLVQQDPDPTLRCAALGAVAGSAFRNDCVPAMAELLRLPGAASQAEPPQVRRAALAGLVKARALDELLRIELSEDRDEAMDLAEGLGKIGDSAAQPRLLLLLQHSSDRVRAGAARALGEVGDLRAVEELRKAVDSGWLAKLALGRAAESAIDQIQDRFGGSQAGEISLASVAPLDGAVSRTADTADADGGNGGEVSLAVDATGDSLSHG